MERLFCVSVGSRIFLCARRIFGFTHESVLRCHVSFSFGNNRRAASNCISSKIKGSSKLVDQRNRFLHVGQLVLGARTRELVAEAVAVILENSSARELTEKPRRVRIRRAHRSHSTVVTIPNEPIFPFKEKASKPSPSPPRPANKMMTGFIILINVIVGYRLYAKDSESVKGKSE